MLLSFKSHKSSNFENEPQYILLAMNVCTQIFDFM